MLSSASALSRRLSLNAKSAQLGLGDRMGHLTAEAFRTYGAFVGRNPGKVLIFMGLFTLATLPGLAFVRINLDLYKLFVPLDAPVRFEFEHQKSYNEIPPGKLDLPLGPPPSLIATDPPPASSQMGEGPSAEAAANELKDIPKKRNSRNASPTRKVHEDPSVPQHSDILRFYVVHRDYENLLHSDTLGKLFDYTNEMMKVTMEYDGETWLFEDFCKKAPAQQQCSNELNIWLKHAENLFRSNGTRHNPNLQLSYPVMYLFNRPKDIGNIIYGVNVTGQKHEIVGARVLTIHWFVAFPLAGGNLAAFLKYRERLNKFWDGKTAESDINFIPHNDKAMDDELRLIIETAIPFALPATLQLMLFVYLTNLARDVRKSKPMEAFFGVISVCLSLAATFGLTFYAGLPFNPVSSTMPFLILAVGVDDAFLLLGAWRMTDPRWSLERRMGATMSDAGASITVTSLTNFGCFALGYFLSPTPAVADFCILTAVGVAMDYFYQVTFFGAMMVYGGMREDQGGLIDYFRCKTASNSGTLQISARPPGGRRLTDELNEPTIMHRFFKQYFGPFILRQEVKALSWVVFLLYICVSFYGCANMRVDISPKKYIRDNSPIQTFVYLADKYIWADNVMPSMHIMNPPDFRNATERARFNEMVFRLENTRYSIGRVSTNLWLWEYQSFLNDFAEVNYERDFYKRFYLRNFFSQFDYQQFRGMVKIMDDVADGQPCIKAFTFQTSFYGLDSWDKRQTELFRWRSILAQFPEFGPFLAGIFSPFLIDQRRTIAPSSMQSVGSAVAVMTLISLFFLPDKQSVFFMSFSLISISCGVCGFLCLWGSDLDSVSMGCIIMAIGLAVDFSIHICYRYNRCSEEVASMTAEQKVIETLSIVGFPVLQAGCSTLWAMTTLPLVQAYLVRVFFQTVVLVCVFGLLHALLWLPQFISALDPCERIPRRVRHPHGH
uniref:SSD domain-containing protein n=2 Tax=Globodera TaxID=31242 RepID=A0A914GVP8_GLORO